MHLYKRNGESPLRRRHNSCRVVSQPCTFSSAAELTHQTRSRCRASREPWKPMSLDTWRAAAPWQVAVSRLPFHLALLLWPPSHSLRRPVVEVHTCCLLASASAVFPKPSACVRNELWAARLFYWPARARAARKWAASEDSFLPAYRYRALSIAIPHSAGSPHI